MSAFNKINSHANRIRIDQDKTRTEALSLFPVEGLQYLDHENAQRCQLVLGHGKTFGVWETPEEMIPYLAPTIRRINLRERIRAFLPEWTNNSPKLDSLLDEGVLWLTRLGLLMRIGPSGIGNKLRLRSIDASTIARALYGDTVRIVAKGIVRKITSPSPEKIGFAIFLTPDDINELRSARHVQDELKRLTALQNRDLWVDALPNTQFVGKTTSPRGTAVTRLAESNKTPYQPISDGYLAIMGERVLWIIQELGPNLIHLLESLSIHFEKIDFSKTPGVTSNKITRRLIHYFGKNTWRDRTGAVIIAPPFPIKHGSQRGKNNALKPIDPFDWHIRKWASVANLALTLQSAHLWVTLLMTAGRLGEVMTLDRNSIEWAKDGEPYVNGKTYKLKQSLDGEDRQWPAPDILVDVLAQQVKLINACEHLAILKKGQEKMLSTEDRSHLWASLGSSPIANHEEKLGTVTRALSTLAERLGLDPKPGGMHLHSHRLRKTLARLAGLAIDGSPKILMRLLGHKDITMTLGYILTDPAMAKDIDDVTRELRIMRAEGLVKDMYEALHATDALAYGGHSGGAASVLSAAVRSHEEQLHRTGRDWDVHSAHELAVLLTNNGQSMRLVSAHVVCTKTEGEVGLCSKKKGAVNTGNCQSECVNRIEEKTGRRDTQKVIPIVIANAKKAIVDNDLLTAASYAQQLMVELKRFDDIGAQWSDSPDVLAILETII